MSTYFNKSTIFLDYNISQLAELVNYNFNQAGTQFNEIEKVLTPTYNEITGVKKITVKSSTLSTTEEVLTTIGSANIDGNLAVSESITAKKVELNNGVGMTINKGGITINDNTSDISTKGGLIVEGKVVNTPFLFTSANNFDANYDSWTPSPIDLTTVGLFTLDRGFTVLDFSSWSSSTMSTSCNKIKLNIVNTMQDGEIFTVMFRLGTNAGLLADGVTITKDNLCTLYTLAGTEATTGIVIKQDYTTITFMYISGKLVPISDNSNIMSTTATKAITIV